MVFGGCLPWGKWLEKPSENSQRALIFPEAANLCAQELPEQRGPFFPRAPISGKKDFWGTQVRLEANGYKLFPPFLILKILSN
jgi:hypothetical protein